MTFNAIKNPNSIPNPNNPRSTQIAFSRTSQ